MNLICLPGAPASDASNAPHYPSDKSLSHRVLLLAMLEEQETTIENLNLGGAITPLLEAMRILGVAVGHDEHGRTRVGNLNRSGAGADTPYLNLGSSSAAARMLIGVLAGLGRDAIIDGDATLRPRPIDWVVDPLRALGAKIDYLAAPGQLPVHVRPSKLHAGAVELHVGSAQALSAVLFAAYAADIDVSITQRVRSRDHTQRLMRALGATITEDQEQVHFAPGPRVPLQHYSVPVDPSAVVYPIAARLLSDAPTLLRISGVCLNDTRTGMLELMRLAGAPITYTNLREAWGEPIGDVELAGCGVLSAFHLNSDQLFHAMIDEVPLAISLATQIAGRSTFEGLGELTFKETNRITSTAAMLAAFGARVTVRDNSVTVEGRQRLLAHSTVPSFADHRLAMSAATLGLGLSLGTSITNGDCHRTSFPDFIGCMGSLGFGLLER